MKLATFAHGFNNYALQIHIAVAVAMTNWLATTIISGLMS